MKRSSSISRLPVSRGARASSTSRASSSTQVNTPSLRRSKSSLSLRRTPQSVSCSTIKSKKRDVRPIQDKAWQAAALERTQHYFQQNPESRQLLNKGVSIRPITLKMFVQLTNIVLKNIDANFDDLTLSNYVELLPMQLNTLMYPGVITASNLKTANTMHSWPHILAILAWLVELHELSLMVNIEETILDIPPNASLDVQIKKSELKVMLDFFQQFNEGKESDENQDIIIENMYKNLFNYSESDFEHNSKKLHKLNEELRSAKAILANDQPTCSTLEYADRLKHLNNLIETEEQTNEDLNTRTTELLMEAEIKKRACKEAEKSIESLKERVKNQPVNLAQRIDKLKEIEDLKREIELIKEEKKHQLNFRDEKDMELSEMKRKIEQIVLNYNIVLMRPSVQHPELNEIALRQDKLLQSNMKEFISNKIETKQKLLSELELKTREAEETLATLKVQKENRQQAAQANKRKIQDERNKRDILKKQLETLASNQEQEDKQRKRDMDEMKQRLQILRDDNPNIEHKLEQLKKAKIRCDELKNKLYSKQENVEEFFKQIEAEIRKNQVPRYEKIRKIIIGKVDKAVSQYATAPHDE